MHPASVGTCGIPHASLSLSQTAERTAPADPPVAAPGRAAPSGDQGIELATVQSGSITVLALDDDAEDAEILRRKLAMIQGFTFEFTHLSSADAVCSTLVSVSPDVVFLDYFLGSASGLDVLRTIRSSGFGGPVIMVTGQGDQYVVADLIRAGADDYICKADLCPLLLERAIHNAMRLHWRRALEARNRELLVELQAARDALEKKNRRLAELYDMAHRFVADVSHDFRTPLTVIKEFAAILAEGLAGEMTAEQREYVGYISERADDLSVMVTDLLDLSHHDAGLLRIIRARHEPHQIAERSLRALERKAAAANVRLVLDLPPDLPCVYCDAERIGRVLINLTVNALKYSPQGTCVRVWARCDEDPDLIRICVSDEGPGIALEDQPALFERFRQIQSEGRTTRKGFGLGLSIAKELVQLNLGAIGVDSRLAGGSMFWFTLPMASPEAITRQYLQFVERSSPGRAVASLLLTRIESGVEPHVADDFDVFLQNALRCPDVPLRLSSHRWLLMVTTARSELTDLTERIEFARQEANRNRPSVSLPSPHFEVMSVWRSGEPVEPLVAQAVELAARGRRPHES